MRRETNISCYTNVGGKANVSSCELSRLHYIFLIFNSRMGNGIAIYLPIGKAAFASLYDSMREFDLQSYSIQVRPWMGHGICQKCPPEIDAK